MTRLGSAQLDAASFSAVLNQGGWPDHAFCWVRWQDAALLGTPSKAPRPLNESTSGRVFWEHGELSWNRTHNHYLVVYLGEDDWNSPPMEFHTMDLVHGEPHIEHVRIHGLHVFDMEALPTCGAGQHLAITRKHYHCRIHGPFTRFSSVRALHIRDFEPAKGGDHA